MRMSFGSLFFDLIQLNMRCFGTWMLLPFGEGRESLSTAKDTVPTRKGGGGS